nr:hypothetical protein [Tanacetum cinerariifolium]
MTAGQRKPKNQWTGYEIMAANLDQRLKSLIMSVLPDDQMNTVINCLTAKLTWNGLILYHEGPSDVKESRVMDLKLCYNTFKFKECESLTQTFTRYKALMNELVNDDIKLSKLEINTSFINRLPKKWLSFCQSLRNTNNVKDYELASLFDSPDDEEDTRSSHKYLNDLEEEYQARALLAKSKRFFKKAEENDVVSKEGVRNGKKDLVFVKSSADNIKVTRPGVERPWLSEAKGFILPNHYTGRILLAESQRNTIDPSVVVTDSSTAVYDSTDESLVCRTPLPPLKKLNDVEPISGPKTIKSILRSKSTFKNEALKGVIINEPSSAPAKGNKCYLALKVHSAPAGKLKSVKIKDDPPLAIVMKELNNLKLQVNKNQSSYSRSNQSQQVPQNALQNKYKTQFKKSYDLCGLNNHLFENCYKVLFCKRCEKTDHKTCDHVEYISTMNMSQHLESLGRASSRSKIPRLSKRFFLPWTHYGCIDHLSNKCLYYPLCGLCGSYDHDINGHNGIISLEREINPRNPQHALKICEVCGSSTHTTTVHYDIEWFKRVYIHNQKDHLGKFNKKADDGYLLGYSLVSKAFRVFNTRIQQTEKTNHITFDESPYAIKFLKPLVDNINIAETERYPPNEYLHPYEPSQRYQTNSNDMSFIELYEYPEPVVLETEVSSDQNGQNDQSAQNDEILNNDHSKHSNHTSDEQIIKNLQNTKDIHISEHLSSPSVEDTSIQNTIPILTPSLPISSMVTPAPQDRWSQDKHIELVNIIDFLSEEEPKKVSEALKHPGWVDAMQDKLNQFARNKVWTLVPTPYGKTIIGSKWVFRTKRDETRIV